VLKGSKFIIETVKQQGQPASADRTARRQYQTVCAKRYEAKCVQRRCFQCGSVPLRSDIKGMELPPANILIPIGNCRNCPVRAKVSGEGVVPGECFLVSTKLDTFCYPKVQTAPCYVPSFWHNTSVWRTDRQTDGIAIASTALGMQA